MSSTKRVIEETNEDAGTLPLSPKRPKPETDGKGEKVGATELASAMALASLASFSPKTENKEKTTPPEARDVEQTEDGSITSWEANNGATSSDPTPVTPEARFAPSAREKRVSFAPGVKENQRKED